MYSYSPASAHAVRIYCMGINKVFSTILFDRSSARRAPFVSVSGLPSGAGVYWYSVKGCPRGTSPPQSLLAAWGGGWRRREASPGDVKRVRKGRWHLALTRPAPGDVSVEPTNTHCRKKRAEAGPKKQKFFLPRLLTIVYVCLRERGRGGKKK